MEKILSVSQAKSQLNALVDDVLERDGEFIITKNGKPAAVLITPLLYEGWKETLEIEGNQAMMRDIKRGLKRLREKSKRLSFEDVFGEALFK